MKKMKFKSVIVCTTLISMMLSNHVAMSVSWTDWFLGKVKKQETTVQEKIALYQKCFRGKCTQPEKDMVRADWIQAQKTGKKVLKWLVIAAIVLGIVKIIGKTKELKRILTKHQLARRSDDPLEEKVFRIFVGLYELPQLFSTETINAMLITIYGQFRSTKPSLQWHFSEDRVIFSEKFLKLLAELYYKHPASEEEYVNFLNTFNFGVPLFVL